MTRTIMLAAVLIALSAACPEIAGAQFYKGRTIIMIVNYPAGGPTDIEARVIAQHLPAHVPGKPTIIIKNVGGGGGLIGSNQLGEAAPTGDTMGFFTLDMPGQLLATSAMRVRYSDFVLIAGVESPLIVYMRKDTPPGVNVATDVMKTSGFKALSLNLQNSNTINQALSLDLLGINYQPVPAYRGLKEVETAILQNIGQMANSSLSGWRGSVEPTMGNIVIPLWQLAPRAGNGTYPRSKALPGLPTFEEFYAAVHPDKKLAGNFTYEVLRAIADPQLAMFRVALMPPKTSEEAVATMRTAFAEMWKSPDFLADYSRIIKTEPILVSGSEGQEILTGLGRIRPEVKEFLVTFIDRMSTK
jgi:tripartite-type tricarboxylate transporter receptor subunit TctC